MQRWMLAVLGTALAVAARGGEEISVKSLLADMTDLAIGDQAQGGSS